MQYMKDRVKYSILGDDVQGLMMLKIATEDLLKLEFDNQMNILNFAID